jgi:hypothetical protein
MPDETVKELKWIEGRLWQAGAPLVVLGDPMAELQQTRQACHECARRLEPLSAALARRDAALLEVAKEMMEKPDSLTPWPTMSAMIQAWSGRIREIVAGEKESGG